MQQLWITRHGGPEVLMLRETDSKSPSAGHVRIRSERIGVNYADVLARRGHYPEAPPPPMIVGYEVSGTVDAVGSNEDESWLGKRVLAPSFFGAYSSEVIVPIEHLFEIPDSLSWDTAAALPVNYGTAYGLIYGCARLQAGDWVLIHSAGGGVGLALLELCLKEGGRPICLASEGKHERLRGKGATHTLDPKHCDIAAAVKEITQGTGLAASFNSAGGDTWERDRALLGPLGQLLLFGNADLGDLSGQRYSALALLQQNFGVRGLNLATLWKHHFSTYPRWIKELLTLAVAGEIHPTIDSVVPLAEGAAAHQRLEDRKNFGKVLLRQ